jgi:hypothetical protein
VPSVVKGQKSSVELREGMDVEATGVVIRRNRLRWFGHVEREKDTGEKMYGNEDDGD